MSQTARKNSGTGSIAFLPMKNTIGNTARPGISMMIQPALEPSFRPLPLTPKRPPYLAVPLKPSSNINAAYTKPIASSVS